MSRKKQVHYFFSHLRRGLGAGIQPKASSQGDEAEKRATVAVTLTVNVSNQDGTVTPQVIKQPVALYGPGDVLGFDPQKLVLRAQPTPDDGNFIANNIPFIEFKEPDFPWRYSAVQDEGNWIPWVTLITLKMADLEEEGEFEWDNRVRSGLPRRIKIKANTALPDLLESWRWAHVHCNDEDGKTMPELEEKIRNTPSFAIARLFCPRQLKPGVKYCAFVVPAYQLGLEAGMDLPTVSDRSQLAWEGNIADNDFELPFYYHWEFRTGLRGDFEDLVKLIQPRLLERLSGREINVDNPGYHLINKDPENPRIAIIEGALQSADANDVPDTNNNPLHLPEMQKLANVLNSVEATDETGQPILDEDGENELRVVPPIYGRWMHFRETSDVNLQLSQNNPAWLEEVNLDLRYRIAAGLGVQYVKEHQEELMDAAWKQLEQVNKKNIELNLGRFGRAVSTCLHKRISKVNNIHKLISLTGPINHKLKAPISRVDRATTFSKLQGFTVEIDNWSIQNQLNLSNISNAGVNTKLGKYSRGRFNKKTPQSTAPAIDSYRLDKLNTLTTGRSRMTNSPKAWAKYEPPQSYIKGINNFEEIKSAIVSQIQPEVTIADRLAKTTLIRRAWEQQQRPNKPLAEDPIGPAMAYPEFHAPMYNYLLELSEDYFVPNLDQILQNTISALISNRKFIEAFMIGLNHEFASELRWRGYPTDLRGSFFRKFWDTTIYSLDEKEKKAFRDSPQGKTFKANLEPAMLSWNNIEDAYFNLEDERVANAYELAIEQWMLTREEDKEITVMDSWERSSNLGTHKVKIGNTRASDNEVVLLLRAELLRKYPNTFIYLIHQDHLGKSEKELKVEKVQVFPIFEASLPPDIICLGFPFDEDSAREHYIIFEERLSEQRFGLDVSIDDKRGSQLINLSWEHFEGLASEGYLNGTEPVTNDASKHWESSTFIARAFTQRPIRMAVHLDSILAKNKSNI